MEENYYTLMTLTEDVKNPEFDRRCKSRSNSLEMLTKGTLIRVSRGTEELWPTVMLISDFRLSAHFGKLLIEHAVVTEPKDYTDYVQCTEASDNRSIHTRILNELWKDETIREAIKAALKKVY